MNIVIAADHRGFSHKNYIINSDALASFALEWIDVGTHNAQRTDYPLYARKAVRLIHEEKAPLGILICGTGVGMAIAANRVPGIYAGVAWNAEIARQGKEDDNINVLVIPSDFVTQEEAVTIIHSWLSTSFKGGRYQERLALIDGE